MKIFKYSKSIQKIFKKYRQNKTLTVSQTTNDRYINSVNWFVYTYKEYKFVKKQQAEDLLSNLG